MDVKVSVIIPVYNGEKTIEKCLDSVLSQTLNEIEVIVVNDGSTDGTLEILNSYGDKIKVITVLNNGQGLARNKGLEIAAGEYIGFVDADDTIDDAMYETMYKKASAFDADMVQCAIKDIRNTSTQIRPKLCDEFVSIKDNRRYVRNYFYELKHTNEVCNKLFKAEFLRENGFVFDDTREVYSEDLKFNIDILPYLGTVFFIEKAFYNYYISDDGHCKKSPEERLYKISGLYKKAIDNISDSVIKNAVKSTALITLMSYSADIIDTKAAKEIIKSKTTRDYMVSSMRYKKTLKHIILMLSLIISPLWLKKKIIVRQYTY